MGRVDEEVAVMHFVDTGGGSERRNERRQRAASEWLKPSGSPNRPGCFGGYTEDAWACRTPDGLAGHYIPGCRRGGWGPGLIGLQ